MLLVPRLFLQLIRVAWFIYLDYRTISVLRKMNRRGRRGRRGKRKEERKRGRARLGVLIGDLVLVL
jgi:hypothetical protein